MPVLICNLGRGTWLYTVFGDRTVAIGEGIYFGVRFAIYDLEASK